MFWVQTALRFYWKIPLWSGGRSGIAWAWRTIYRTSVSTRGASSVWKFVTARLYAAFEIIFSVFCLSSSPPVLRFQARLVFSWATSAKYPWLLRIVRQNPVHPIWKILVSCKFQSPPFDYAQPLSPYIIASVCAQKYPKINLKLSIRFNSKTINFTSITIVPQNNRQHQWV